MMAVDKALSLQGGKTARLFVLGASNTTLEVTVTGMSGQTLSAELPHEVPVNSPVRVDWGDQLLLGEVTQCRRSEAGCTVNLSIQQMLTSVRDLQSLLAAVLGEGPVRVQETKR